MLSLVKDIKLSFIQRKLLVWTFKISILFFSWRYMYQQAFVKGNLDLVAKSYKEIFSGSHIYLFIFNVILIFVNWGLESYKWRFMLKKVEKISMLTSIKAIFTGLTVSFFSPNRMGEFGGRVLYLQTDRLKGSVITILCNMSQLLITLIAGALALLFYSKKLTNIDPLLVELIMYLSLASMLICILVFLYPSLILALIFKLGLRGRKVHFLSVLKKYSKKDQLYSMWLSLLRYFVFSLQFYFMLKIFNVDIPFFVGLEHIALTYFVVTAVPTMALSEIGVRGSTALYFLGGFTSNPINVVSASLTVWVINLVIPAILGSFFLISQKIDRE